jgi:hypothetical protein
VAVGPLVRRQEDGEDQRLHAEHDLRDAAVPPAQGDEQDGDGARHEQRDEHPSDVPPPGTRRT